MISKTCPECGEPFYGRSDKKFCDDGCRNIYNNKLNSDTTNHVRNINNSLRKNRRILEKLLIDNTERVPWQSLALIGFNFSYCTHIKTTTDGKMYFYCYEYGYLLWNSECILMKSDQP
jgi:hypothetical protein